MEVGLEEYIRLTEGDPSEERNGDEIELGPVGSTGAEPTSLNQRTITFRQFICSPFMLKIILVVCFLVGVGISIAVAFQMKEKNSSKKNYTPSTDRSVKFIIVGDTGTGGPDQYTVANAMKQVCDERSCDFGLLVGDVIYETGATSIDDKQFLDKFELPFSKLNFTFYTIAGNHDCGMNDEQGACDMNHQVLVDYANSGKTNRMIMPDRYYSFSQPAVDPIVDFFAIETNSLVMKHQSKSYDYDAYNTKQKTALDKGFNNSSAPWRMVLGHHPYISNGNRGSAGSFDGLKTANDFDPKPYKSGRTFKKWFEESVCNKADVYFSGHTHTLGWLLPVDNCPNTQHIISGAGAKTAKLGPPSKIGTHKKHKYQEGHTLGFWWAEVTATKMTLQVFTVSAKTGELNAAFSDVIQKKN